MKREIMLIIISVLAIPILLYGIISFLPEAEAGPDDYQVRLAGSSGQGEYRIEAGPGLAWAE